MAVAGAFEIGQVMIILSVLFVTAFFASTVFKRFGMPGLVGEILAGVIVANIVIGDWSLLGDFLQIERPGLDAGGSFVEGNVYWSVLEVLAELGVVFLLFAVGLETKVKDLMSVGRTAMIVAVLGVVIPLILGYAVIMVWYDGDVYLAMFMGAAMVATSVGITAQVIKDMNTLDTPESRIIIGAAVIDDILGIIVLTVVAGMAATGGVINVVDITEIIVIAVMFVVAALVFASRGVPYICRRIRESGKNSRIDLFVVAIAVCIVISTLADQMRLAMIIGAFLAGMIFADCGCECDLEKKMSSITALLLPFFFVYVGLHIDFGLFTRDLLYLAAIVIVLAVISKYIGCGLGTVLGDREKKSSPSIVGAGMIPRGEVGIIVAVIGVGLLLATDPKIMDIFAVVVLMSVVTTLITPFLLSHLFKKKYGDRTQMQRPDDDGR